MVWPAALVRHFSGRARDAKNPVVAVVAHGHRARARQGDVAVDAQVGGTPARSQLQVAGVGEDAGQGAGLGVGDFRLPGVTDVGQVRRSFHEDLAATAALQGAAGDGGTVDDHFTAQRVDHPACVREAGAVDGELTPLGPQGAGVGAGDACSIRQVNDQAVRLVGTGSAPWLFRPMLLMPICPEPWMVWVAALVRTSVVAPERPKSGCWRCCSRSRCPCPPG